MQAADLSKNSLPADSVSGIMQSISDVINHSSLSDMVFKNNHVKPDTSISAVTAAEKLLAEFCAASGPEAAAILTVLASIEKAGKTDLDNMEVQLTNLAPKDNKGSKFDEKPWTLMKKHWLYADVPHVPPMPMRMGTHDEQRALIVKAIKDAGKYAMKVTSRNGDIQNFDPDDFLNNLVIGMIGYWTDTGLSLDDSINPKEACPVLRCEVLKEEVEVY
jgi:hypothetical protein